MISAGSTSGIDGLLKRRWLLVLLVWTVPALLAALETFTFWHLGGRDFPFWRAFVMEGPAWLTYAIATPVIFIAARRLPIRRPHLARHVSVHMLLALVAGALYACTATLATLSFSPFPQQSSFAKMSISWFLSGLPLSTLTYFGILGVGTALIYLAEARQREMDAARLAAQLAEARLGALRMQLHPHFLFNTLNTITVLAKDGDNTSVARMLTMLGGLLRDVLRNDDVQFIPLDAELAFSRQYLAIELVRFADRLTIREAIEPDVETAPVPVFLLQPLIENALRHGIGPKAAGGTIEIGGRRVDGGVEVWVDDDGVGLPAHWTDDDRYGIGLSNVASRLRELYGDRATLAVTRRENGGTRSAIHLPR
jgi:signal transduction histidine kinase